MIPRHAVRRFLRYSAAGLLTLSLDLVLLYGLVQLGVPYYVATPIGFLMGVSVNYLVVRQYVFKGTERTLHAGYAYFLVFALGGAALVTLAVSFLVTAFGLQYLVARLLVGVFTGIGNYLLNLYLNFRVVGHHAEIKKR